MSTQSKPYAVRTHKKSVESRDQHLSEQAKADKKNARCHQRSLQRAEENVKLEKLRITSTQAAKGKISKEDSCFLAKHK